ncbi:MAG: phytoene/squalene synthase family protein [Pseudolabrys sp.]
MQNHFEYCARLVREVDRERYLATLFAPAGYRNALFALYAFNVEISRVRDFARESMPGEIRLQWWREIFLGERAEEAASNPTAAALLETLGQYNRERLIALIDAHTFDLYNEPMPAISDLQSYAVTTTGSIFELAASILCGDTGLEVAALAAEAGQAQTIANVLAQLPRHAARRQLYVPVEVLQHYRAEPDDIFALRATPEVRAALAELRLRARRHLARVGAAGTEIPKNMQPAFLPLAPLWRWLRDMERPDYDPFRPPQVAPWRRQWRIWRAAKSFRRVGA